MSEGAWDSLISVNKKSELKYRNISPTLKISLGCPDPKKNRDLIPSPKKAPTLYNIIEEAYDASDCLYFRSTVNVTSPALIKWFFSCWSAAKD